MSAPVVSVLVVVSAPVVSVPVVCVLVVMVVGVNVPGETAGGLAERRRGQGEKSESDERRTQNSVT